MSKKQEDTLIDLWNRLDGLWEHHQDGSDFWPRKFLPSYNSLQKNIKEIESRGKESVLFDIIFNEIQHKIKDVIPKNRHKELN